MHFAILENARTLASFPWIFSAIVQPRTTFSSGKLSARDAIALPLALSRLVTSTAAKICSRTSLRRSFVNRLAKYVSAWILVSISSISSAAATALLSLSSGKRLKRETRVIVFLPAVTDSIGN